MAAPTPDGPFLNVFFPGVRGDQFATKVGQFCGEFSNECISVFLASEHSCFSDGYTNATNNRQLFPISDGHILWRGSSTNWSASVAIAFGPNPNSPDSFTNGTNERFVVPPFTGKDTSGCMAVNISTLISPEIRIGANATLQLVQDTGGQRLYQVCWLPRCTRNIANMANQCMDIQLGEGNSLPEGVKCTTPLSDDISNPSGSSSIPSSTGSTPSPTTTGTTSGGNTGSGLTHSTSQWVLLPTLGFLFVLL